MSVAPGSSTSAGPSQTSTTEPAASAKELPSSRQAGLWAQASHFTLRLGIQAFASNETVYTVDNYVNGGSQELNLQQDLGFDTSTQVGRFDFGWRFGKRHRLDASYFRIKDSASRVIDEEITIGDTTFPIDATIASSSQTDVIMLQYNYSFFQSKRWDAAAGVGLHTMLFGTSLSTSANGDSISQSITLPAPVPVIGLSAVHAFTPRTRLSAGVDLFGIRIDDVGGSLIDGQLTFDYDITRRFGVGLGLEYFDMTIGAGNSYLGAEAEWSYLGVLFFLRGML